MQNRFLKKRRINCQKECRSCFQRNCWKIKKELLERCLINGLGYSFPICGLRPPGGFLIKRKTISTRKKLGETLIISPNIYMKTDLKNSALLLKKKQSTKQGMSQGIFCFSILQKPFLENWFSNIYIYWTLFSVEYCTDCTLN